MKKILVATEKPFAAVARKEIDAVAAAAGYQVAWLEKYTEPSQLCEAVADADALIVRSDKVTPAVVEAARQLKIVVRAGAGYDNLDLEALKTAGVVAMNTPGQNANGVAELVICQMIYMARNRFAAGSGVEIEGKTLGLHGYGAVARLVAAKAKALGMKVCAYDPFVTAEAMAAEGVTKVDELPALYAGSFAVSIHVPALPSTIGSVNEELLKGMSHSSRCIVLNSARAEVVDEDGMFNALAENPKLCYCADVIPHGDWERFEAAYGNRVWADRIKIGAQTDESNTRAARAAAEQIVAFFEEGVTRFQLNK